MCDGKGSHTQGSGDPGGVCQAQLGQVGVAGRVPADLYRGESGLFGKPCLGVAEAAQPAFEGLVAACGQSGPRGNVQ